MTKKNQTLFKAFACPRRGNLLADYLDKHGKTPSTGPGLVGQVVHEFIKGYFEHCRATGVRTDLSAGHEIARSLEAIHDLGEFSRDFEILTEQFMASEMLPQGELFFESELQAHQGQLYGTPDLVEIILSDEVHKVPVYAEIHDWKTARRIPTQSEIEADMQLKFYAYLLAMNEPMIEEFTLNYHFVRYGVVLTFCMDRAQVVEYGVQVERMVARIDSMTAWPARPGSVCQYCEFVRDCPIVDAPAEGREARAAKLKVIKTQAAAIEKDLKADVEQNGPIRVGDEVLDFVAAPKTVFPDVLKVYDLMMLHDLKPGQVWPRMSITKTAVKSLCKGNPELLTEALDLAVEKTGTEFTFKTVGPE